MKNLKVPFPQYTSLYVKFRHITITVSFHSHTVKKPCPYNRQGFSVIFSVTAILRSSRLPHHLQDGSAYCRVRF